MSILSERFTEFSEFVDCRQDQLMEVLRAKQTLQNLELDDPDEMLRIISELNPDRLYTMYVRKCNDISQGNYTLHQQIRNASFRPFKAVLGDDDYV